VRVKQARLRIGLLPLLVRRVQVRRMQLSGVSVALEENSSGQVNWLARAAAPAPSATPEEQSTRPSAKGLPRSAKAFVVESLVLENVRISYTNPKLKQPVELHIAKGEGATRADAPAEIKMSGDAMGHPFKARISIGALGELLARNRAWMRIETTIAHSEFALEGAVDIGTPIPQLEVTVSVQGERLDSLRELLDLDLPPIKAYRAAANLVLQRRRADLTELELRVGKSLLKGQGFVDRRRARPIAALQLTAPQIRLHDFDVGDWSPTPAPVAAAPSDKAGKLPPARPQKGERLAELLSPEVLDQLDAQLRVRVDSVLAGKDKLGRGRLEAELKKGRISVAPLELNVPGGKFLLNLSFKPGATSTDARLRLLVKDYDIGVLARYRDPKTDLGGVINLDMDLTSTAGSLDGILANANGYIDIAAVPQNLRAGVMNLWAVNLIAAVLRRADKDASRLNCLVGRWSMHDGILTPDVLAIDTDRIRVCSTGKLDFKRREVELVAAPLPKTPEFFSLATPFKVRGKFSDFKIGLKEGALVISALSFITSPLHVPLRRLAGEGLPQDGHDVCRMAIGPHKGAIAPAPGCAEVPSQATPKE